MNSLQPFFPLRMSDFLIRAHPSSNEIIMRILFILQIQDIDTSLYFKYTKNSPDLRA